MEFHNFQALLESVHTLPKKTIAVAAAHDEHTLEALQKAASDAPISFKLVGDADKIRRICDALSFEPGSNSIIDCKDDAESAKVAVGLVRDGSAQALMKGKLQTGTLLKAVVDRDSGIRTGGVMSHAAVLESPAYHKLFVVTDGGMITRPDVTQKEQIAINAIGFLRSMGYAKPKVAALAAAETVSPKMPETEDAALLASRAREGLLGECSLEGPLSFDIAISSEMAKVKGFESTVSGDADILLVPDIAAGNILCKGLLFLGKCKMAGCVLGAKAPIILVSRGATAEEKFLSIMLSLSLPSAHC